MSKSVGPKAKPARRVLAKSARTTLSARQRRSTAEDRLDGENAMKALKESAERIPYQDARRDPTVSLGSNRKFLQLIGRSRMAWESKGGLSAPQVRLRLSRPAKKRHRRKP
jgi:hypothetical protein